MKNMPKGRHASLRWDGRQWVATVDHAMRALPTLFLSPRSAKDDSAWFEREALSHLQKVMAAGPRPLAEQKGPLAIGARS